MNALILGILWMIYYALHSALATIRIKSFFARQSSPIYASYRFLYSAFSLVNFILLLRFHSITFSENIFKPPFFLQIVGFGFAIAALIVFTISLANYRFSSWIFLPGKAEKSPLITSGINGIVRHPMYFGVILILIGMLLVLPKWKNLTFAVVTVIYIIIGSLLEEQKLTAEYGNAYLAYREKVKMLIPFVI